MRACAGRCAHRQPGGEQAGAVPGVERRDGVHVRPHQGMTQCVDLILELQVLKCDLGASG